MNRQGGHENMIGPSSEDRYARIRDSDARVADLEDEVPPFPEQRIEFLNFTAGNRADADAAMPVSGEVRVR